MNRSTVPNAFNTIVWGGFIAGVLDAADGCVAYGILGRTPIQVLQYIASGLLGNRAYAGNTLLGLEYAGLGAALHFFIAFAVATVYYVAAHKLSFLTQKPILWGLLYGASVFLFMTFLVLPHSGVAKGPFSLPLFLNGILGHAIFVGLPIAIWATRPRREAVSGQTSTTVA
jgi:uncharacterized membrane protein YagU involved in acid resistance